MPVERRDLLRLGSVCLGGTIAGCADATTFDGSGPSENSEPDSAPQNDTAPERETDGEDDEPTTDEQQPTEEELLQRLSGKTGTVFEEIEWFVTEHREAIDAYVKALDQVIETVSQLEETTPITDADIERLESDAKLVETTIATYIEPHFELLGYVRQRNNESIERIKRFKRRDDRPPIDEELASLESFYRGIRTYGFRQNELSRDPIQNRLVTFLCYANIGGAIDDALFEFRYRNDDTLTTRAYTEAGAEARGEPNLLGEPLASPAGSKSPMPKPEHTFTELFAPVSISKDRMDELELIVNDWSGYGGTPTKVYTERFPSWPVYIQRYYSESAARSATSAVFNGSAFLEPDRTVAIGDIEWQQVGYRLDGAVFYAPFRQFGPYIVFVAPSRTPIEERGSSEDDDAWTKPLNWSWLRIEA